MSEHEVIEALGYLGLSTYEARVFVALQKLGTGTAQEVHRVADVPRSQVYGTAEQLEERGLVEIQQSSPKQYRPVSLEAARAQLAARFEREEERAFETLETLRHEQTAERAREEVSTLRGRAPINERVEALIERGDNRVVFGAADPALVSEDIIKRLGELATAGAEVMVISENESVRSLFDEQPVAVHSPLAAPSGGFSGRVLLVDEGVVLVSVESTASGEEPATEIALWSADTAIARILVQFLGTGIRAFLERDG